MPNTPPTEFGIGAALNEQMLRDMGGNPHPHLVESQSAPQWPAQGAEEFDQEESVVPQRHEPRGRNGTRPMPAVRKPADQDARHGQQQEMQSAEEPPHIDENQLHHGQGDPSSWRSSGNQVGEQDNPRQKRPKRTPQRPSAAEAWASGPRGEHDTDHGLQAVGRGEEDEYVWGDEGEEQRPGILGRVKQAGRAVARGPVGRVARGAVNRYQQWRQETVAAADEIHRQAFGDSGEGYSEEGSGYDPHRDYHQRDNQDDGPLPGWQARPRSGPYPSVNPYNGSAWQLQGADQGQPSYPPYPGNQPRPTGVPQFGTGGDVSWNPGNFDPAPLTAAIHREQPEPPQQKEVREIGKEIDTLLGNIPPVGEIDEAFSESMKSIYSRFADLYQQDPQAVLGLRSALILYGLQAGYEYQDSESAFAETVAEAILRRERTAQYREQQHAIIKNLPVEFQRLVQQIMDALHPEPKADSSRAFAAEDESGNRSSSFGRPVPPVSSSYLVENDADRVRAGLASIRQPEAAQASGGDAPDAGGGPGREPRPNGGENRQVNTESIVPYNDVVTRLKEQFPSLTDAEIETVFKTTGRIWRYLLDRRTLESQAFVYVEGAVEDYMQANGLSREKNEDEYNGVLEEIMDGYTGRDNGYYEGIRDLYREVHHEDGEQLPIQEAFLRTTSILADYSKTIVAARSAPNTVGEPS